MRKAEYVRELGLWFSAGGGQRIRWLELTDAEVIDVLTERRGIGRWTAEMFLIFCSCVRTSFRWMISGFCARLATCMVRTSANGSRRCNSASSGNLGVPALHGICGATWTLFR